MWAHIQTINNIVAARSPTLTRVGLSSIFNLTTEVGPKFSVMASPRSAHLFNIITMMAMLMVGALLPSVVVGKPFPAPDLSICSSPVEHCCMPKYTGNLPYKKFEFNLTLPMRTRRPAHLLDEAYKKQLVKGYELLRSLPDTDPRSLRNQQRLHCLYCDNALYYPNVTAWPLEIHNGWLFMPWHRMFIYFHERILAKILGDDSFALPYWNWDLQSSSPPFANKLPEIYADNTSSLWDPNRNRCSLPPYTIDLNTLGGCTTKSDDELRVQNNRLLYTQLVLGATTPRLFFGMPYRLGDIGGGGPGTMEDNPHGTVHAWMGNPLAPSPFTDMGNFLTSARDPIFYPHHTNVDRIWTIWKTLPGSMRKEPSHPDFMDSEFGFYDENGDIILVKVSQMLDPELLRYKYESSPTPWVTNGLKTGKEAVELCNPTTDSQVLAMIAAFPPFTDQTMLFVEPISFRVPRPPSSSKGTEVLEIQGIRLNQTLQVHWEAYMYFPTADAMTGVLCPEFFGTYNFIPHTGQAIYNPARVWRAAVGPTLKRLGKEKHSHVVVTLVQVGHSIQPIKFTKARILYDSDAAD